MEKIIYISAVKEWYWGTQRYLVQLLFKDFITSNELAELAKKCKTCRLSNFDCSEINENGIAELAIAPYNANRDLPDIFRNERVACGIAGLRRTTESLIGNRIPIKLEIED